MGMTRQGRWRTFLRAPGGVRGGLQCRRGARGLWRGSCIARSWCAASALGGAHAAPLCQVHCRWSPQARVTAFSRTVEQRERCYSLLACNITKLTLLAISAATHGTVMYRCVELLRVFAVSFLAQGLRCRTDVKKSIGPQQNTHFLSFRHFR